MLNQVHRPVIRTVFEPAAQGLLGQGMFGQLITAKAQKAPQNAPIDPYRAAISKGQSFDEAPDVFLIFRRQCVHGRTPGISRATPRKASTSSFR